MSNLGAAACDKPARVALTALRARIADYRGRGVYAGYPDQFRCIFIHVPKTAGSSIARALFEVESRHVPYFEYERANPKKFRSYFKFGFVRNPWDRLVSAFFFLRRGGMNELDRAWAEQNLAAYSTFDAFVREWLNEENIMSFPHFVPQSFYLADTQGNLMVDFLGRYESLAADFAEVARRLGRVCTLPLYNKSEHAAFATYYSADTREIVARVYARDIAFFNYHFDG
jgi:hypothetical protein